MVYTCRDYRALEIAWGGGEQLTPKFPPQLPIGGQDPPSSAVHFTFGGVKTPPPSRDKM
jgi:hypothetical protein